MFKVREGNLERLGLLYERYKKILFTFFYRLNSDVYLSEDLVQNVFVRIIKYRHTFRGQGEFKTWMFHIARNLSHEHYRRNSRKVSTERLQLRHEALTDQAELTGNTQKDHDLKLLNKALDGLSIEKREIILLSKIDGMKYKDIGQILNCTESNVKIRAFRALKELKSNFEKLKQYHE